jgi:hypothetical protein
MEHYEMVFKGHLDLRWARTFTDLEMSLLPSGQTRLSGAVADQAALRGILTQLLDLNLVLIAVTRVEYPVDAHPSLRT